MTIKTTLRRIFHGVALLLIGVVAYFQARGAGQLIGMALMNRAERKSTLPAPPLSGEPLCQSLMFRQAALAPAPEPVPVPATPAAAATPRRQASIISQVRVVPEQQDGQVIGLRLFGIRTGSLLATLGLRNGDRLESINGFPIASPEKALQAYAQLRTASHLHVLVTRVGKPLEIDLNII